MPRSILTCLLLILAMFVAGCGHAAPSASTRSTSAAVRTHAAPPPAWQHLVAQVTAPVVTAYARPDTAAPRSRIRPAELDRGAQSFLVVRSIPDWVQVLLPARPNGSRAWLRTSHVKLVPTNQELRIDTAHRRLVLRDRGRVVLTTRVAVGAAATPTPRGAFFIVNAVRLTDPNGPYGPWAIGLSAHSNVLRSFNGRDAQIAVHGTNDPQTLGEAVSNGCIHVPNAVVERLVMQLHEGTPVTIV
jgi:lipoprotein-anchoring transpeptidase ErfK/SrfK